MYPTNEMIQWGDAYAQWIKINAEYQEEQLETGYYPSELSRALVEATIRAEDAWQALNNQRLPIRLCCEPLRREWQEAGGVV